MNPATHTKACVRIVAIQALLVSPGARELAALRELAAELAELIEGISVGVAPRAEGAPAPVDVAIALAPRSFRTPNAERARRRRAAARAVAAEQQLSLSGMDAAEQQLSLSGMDGGRD
ncbi:MAG: hypothetical protein QOG85_821, partial [Gaiellaceae bacterium]|nr:hypothetical protein [Gaiellaceae bacterium]